MDKFTLIFPSYWKNNSIYDHLIKLKIFHGFVVCTCHSLPYCRSCTLPVPFPHAGNIRQRSRRYGYPSLLSHHSVTTQPHCKGFIHWTLTESQSERRDVKMEVTYSEFKNQCKYKYGSTDWKLQDRLVLPFGWTSLEPAGRRAMKPPAKLGTKWCGSKPCGLWNFCYFFPPHLLGEPFNEIFCHVLLWMPLSVTCHTQ